MWLSVTALHALATENCNVRKVNQAMILEPGGIAQKALSEQEYKERLDLKTVRVTTPVETRHPDKSRLTVVIDNGKHREVKHIYCQ
jgi:hypothetical protein